METSLESSFFFSFFLLVFSAHARLYSSSVRIGGRVFRSVRSLPFIRARLFVLAQ